MTLVERALPVPRGGPLYRTCGGQGVECLAQCKVQSEKHITYCADANCTVQGIEGRGGAHQGPLGTHFGEFVKTAKVMQQQLAWTGDDLNFMFHKR